MANKALDYTTLHDYVVAHGFGKPTSDGLALAKRMYTAGDDYATIAHEVVFRDLVDRDRQEEEPPWQYD